MITFAVTCRTCGRQYEPSSEAIIAGVWRRACPYCYPPREPPDPVATTPTDRQTVEQETPND